jgi:hypothetical protein
LGQAAKAAKGHWTDVLSAIESLSTLYGNLNIVPDSVADGFFAYGSFLDDVISGVEKSWHEAGAAFDQLSSAMGTLINTIDAIEDFTADSIEYVSSMVDSTYSMVSSARELVDAIGSEVADTWRTVASAGERTVDAVLLEYLGEVSDDALATLLGANPDMIDLAVVPGGYDLKIPVIR